jgi:catechol-2,3-dioxygenase
VVTEVRERPAVEGVLETALYVDDLAYASAFYEDVIGLRPIFSDTRLVAFDAGRGVCSSSSCAARP